MESLFECEFTVSVKMAANRIRRLYPARCIVFPIIGISIFLLMTHFALKYGFTGIWLLYFLFGVFYLIFALLMPEINGLIAVRRFNKDTSGMGGYKVSFGDSIEINQGNIRVYWAYSEISQVRHLKYSYELMKNKRMGIMLDPDGFTKGTFKEFKQFLRGKRPDLKIPE